MKPKLYGKKENKTAPWIKGVPLHYEGQVAIAQYIQNNLRTGSLRICDLGSGDGTTINEISKVVSASFDAVDFKGAHSLEKIRTETEVNVVESAIEALDFGIETYDAISASCSLHHVFSKDRIRVYNNIYAGLRGGGVFALFDIREVNPEVEKAYFRYYVEHAGEKIGKKEAVRRYNLLTGSYFLERKEVADKLKDQFTDKPITLDEQIHLLLNAGFEIQNIHIKKWNTGNIYDKKVIFIGAKK